MTRKSTNRRKFLAGAGATPLLLPLIASTPISFTLCASTPPSLEFNKYMTSGDVTLMVVSVEPVPDDLMVIISTARKGVDAALVTVLYESYLTYGGRGVKVL